MMVPLDFTVYLASRYLLCNLFTYYSAKREVDEKLITNLPKAIIKACDDFVLTYFKPVKARFRFDDRRILRLVK